ncbi:P-loop containing nucleoside triphosphate hydrolase [Phytophthora cactorum]|nr:P-loop containing nucleoside triphosphate hydrolase [Phytophthora cactorum]
MSDMRLFIYRNEAGSEGKVMNLKSKDSIARLKKVASKKLGVRAKRLFLASGAEISDVDELQNNDTLYVSQGEAFYKSLGPANGQETFHMSVLGSGGVGKSALTLRFVRDYFVKDWDPTIEDAYRKAITVDDGSACWRFWIPQVKIMDSRISLHELQPFFDLHLQINESRRPLPPIILVANKKDVVDRDPSKCQVSTEEGRRIAHSYNARYIETSALTGANVTAVFETFVRERYWGARREIEVVCQSDVLADYRASTPDSSRTGQEGCERRSKRAIESCMGDAVLRVRGHLQSLARENWSTLEEKHVRNVSWLRGELVQISRSLEIKARFEAKPAVAASPYPRAPENASDATEPAKKKQKIETQREDAAPPANAQKQKRMSTRLSMRLRPRAQSEDVTGEHKKTRKRGRPSEGLLRDPGKLKVAELRSELKKRGLRTSGLKAVLFDRLLDALEVEQKEDDKHLNQVPEEGVKEHEVIMIDDSDRDEIVRESLGSNKSQRSQSTSPKAAAEDEKETAGPTAEEKAEKDNKAPHRSPQDKRDKDATTGRSSQTEEASSTALDAAEIAPDADTAVQKQQQVSSEADDDSSGHDVEFSTADRAGELITHDEINWTRQSMQVSGRRELTSPLGWKRKSILRKASSLAPSSRGNRKVSFAPNNQVDIIVESSQTDSTQPEPSPEKAPSLNEAKEVHTPREDVQKTRSDSLPEAESKPTTVKSSVATASTATTPEDPPTRIEPEKETDEQRRKREFDESVQREAQKLRAAAKLSAQKRLEEAKASKAFWAKRDQLKAKLRASSVGEKRKSAFTPVASEKVSDQVSPSTSTPAESVSSESTRLTTSASKEAKQPQHTVETTREDPEEAKDHDFMRSMAANKWKASQTCRPPSKARDSRSDPRILLWRTSNKPSESSALTSSTALQKGVDNTKKPMPQTIETLSNRDRSDSLSSTVSSVPEASVVENALKSGAAMAANRNRRPIANLVSGLHSFTSLLEKDTSQSSNNNSRSAPVVNALKLAERSRVAEEKKRLEKEKRKALLKKKMEEHKKAAALKEKAETDAQAKREQERLNERKKREAELARKRQQRLMEMRAGLEKKRAMIAAEKKAGLASSTAMAARLASSAAASISLEGWQVHRNHLSLLRSPVRSHNRSPYRSHNRSPIEADFEASHVPGSSKPFADVVNYEMSDNAESSGGDSDSDSERHGKKKVPRWAQKDHLNKILHAQFGKNAIDPSPAIFQDFVDTCNLEAIFETTDIRKKKKFARRTSSGNWLADRPTARDRALYQRDMGTIGECESAGGRCWW